MPPKKCKETAACGNPLFLKWLGEWMESANATNSKIYHTYKKAYESMSKYPLPFLHPSEAAILSGIGPGICKRLEARLKQHCEESGQPMPQPGDLISNETNETDETASEIEPRREKTHKIYVPKFRSGAYAILLALYKSSEIDSNSSMTKTELIKEAQQYSDASFDIPNGKQRFYTAWNSMKTLLEKNYVYKCGYPVRFCLTEDGLSVARQMVQTACAQGRDLSAGVHLGQAVVPDKIDESVSKRSHTSLGITASEENPENSNFRDAAQIIIEKSSSFPKESQNNFDVNKTNTERELNFLSTGMCTSSGFTSFCPIIWEPGTFEVILILDTREVKLKKDRDYIQETLQQRGVATSVRNLELGDFIWVARKQQSLLHEDIVLDYIVERKRMDDLVGSIKDGRFREQKFRLSKSGAGQVIYLIEDYNLEEVAEFGMSTIKTAMSSIQMLNGYFLKRTANIDQSIDYLVRMTKALKNMYENTMLYAIPDCAIYRNTFLEMKQNLASTYPDRTYHVTYASYSDLNSKSRSLTLKDTFVKMLMTVRGISADKAAEIIKNYPTPLKLIQEFDSYEDDKKKMISDTCKSIIRRKKIGPALSEKIHQVWCADNY